MFPIVIAAGLLALIGFKIGQLKDRPYVTSGATPLLPGRSVAPSIKPAQSLLLLGQLVQRGGFPHGVQGVKLLAAAYAEAQAIGDQQLLGWITQMFVQNQSESQARLQAAAPQEPETVTAGSEGAEFDGTPESWGEFANPSNARSVNNPDFAPVAAPPTAQPATVAPGQVVNATPQGFWNAIPGPNWDEFVSRLATKDAGFKNENYLGKYEHNRRRLRQLGLKEPTNEQEQQQALFTDLGDHYAKCQALFSKFTGQSVDIPGEGTPVQVTASGVLGLLKAAGPRGAEGWLSNPAERQAHPVTTQIFAKTNGCF